MLETSLSVVLVLVSLAVLWFLLRLLLTLVLYFKHKGYQQHYPSPLFPAFKGFAYDPNMTMNLGLNLEPFLLIKAQLNQQPGIEDANEIDIVAFLFFMFFKIHPEFNAYFDNGIVIQRKRVTFSIFVGKAQAMCYYHPDTDNLNSIIPFVKGFRDEINAIKQNYKHDKVKNQEGKSKMPSSIIFSLLYRFPISIRKAFYKQTIYKESSVYLAPFISQTTFDKQIVQHVTAGNVPSVLGDNASFKIGIFPSFLSVDGKKQFIISLTCDHRIATGSLLYSVVKYEAGEIIHELANDINRKFDEKWLQALREKYDKS